jgi:hypothetical protein
MKTATVAALIVLLVGCVAAVVFGGEREDAAVKAAEAWLALVDGGEYDKSWNEAAAYFRGAVKKDDWVASLGAVRSPLGKTVSRTLKGATYATELPGAPDGEYVVIQFETVFSNKGSAVETITPMKDEEGRWRVSGYFIR